MIKFVYKSDDGEGTEGAFSENRVRCEAVMQCRISYGSRAGGASFC